MDAHLVVEALRATGTALGSGGAVIRVFVCGGSAGLLSGLLSLTRTTGDCDVVWDGSEAEWKRLTAAAVAAATELGLPVNWLNRESSIYAWCLPLGWAARCEPVGKFGVLEVVRLSRWDLIAAKIVSAPKRPQDFQDLRQMRPTAEELQRVEEHLDRLEAEHLGGERFDEQRVIVDALRGEA